ncbi:Protein TraJ [Paraburkholderia aspalathi]|uniref:Protein TraJ n=1 Tax=Paraburkholderia aspalathi TaxID=1324617 RepID=A0ABM8SPF8_9BURK|nr:conjugal transfer transcriptional regulator TraJ [Paraburkholderia aspalathi]MBK3822220.1 conjugal transfer transcriptional regulator TraJ [Paraburkholderia aspalathi]MBK3834068.1 conjugal transfer transcriptional regulator TraJ [Paraburkholderia aspalathi]MBK3863816.1 conjugal transfer transcriptional regulator TraJ [Paraburkholderia aspalathi]CAE6823281.1 Protein TraJ [Paraburkholderia aspalathi]
MEEKPTRKSSPPIKVYCLPDERQQVQAQADAAGLSLSAYLLRVGLGYEIHGILDHRRVHDLAKVNGDLGRLGGLLKLWLSNDDRVAGFSVATILALLSKIEDTQAELRAVMTKVVRG